MYSIWKQQKDTLFNDSPYQLWSFMVIRNWMPATHFKQIGAGDTKDWKLWNAPKTPVWNIPQVNRFLGNRWLFHDWIWNGPSKGSVIHEHGWSVRFTFFVKYTIVIKRWLFQEHFIKRSWWTQVICRWLHSYSIYILHSVPESGLYSVCDSCTTLQPHWRVMMFTLFH